MEIPLVIMALKLFCHYSACKWMQMTLAFMHGKSTGRHCLWMIPNPKYILMNVICGDPSESSWHSNSSAITLQASGCKWHSPLRMGKSTYKWPFWSYIDSSWLQPQNNSNNGTGCLKIENSYSKHYATGKWMQMTLPFMNG